MSHNLCHSSELIEALGLKEGERKHFPVYREIFRSVVRTQATKQRRAASSVLFMFTPDASKELWYMLRTDEVISYHAGLPMKLTLIHPDESWDERIVGADVLSGEFPQCLIPAWTWRHMELLPVDEKTEDSWGLFSSFVSPGFEQMDCSESNERQMKMKFPEQFSQMEFRAMGYDQED